MVARWVQGGLGWGLPVKCIVYTRWVTESTKRKSKGRATKVGSMRNGGNDGGRKGREREGWKVGRAEECRNGGGSRLAGDVVGGQPVLLNRFTAGECDRWGFNSCRLACSRSWTVFRSHDSFHQMIATTTATALHRGPLGPCKSASLRGDSADRQSPGVNCTVLTAEDMVEIHSG